MCSNVKQQVKFPWEIIKRQPPDYTCELYFIQNSCTELVPKLDKEIIPKIIMLFQLSLVSFYITLYLISNDSEWGITYKQRMQDLYMFHKQVHSHMEFLVKNKKYLLFSDPTSTKSKYQPLSFSLPE